MKRTLLVLLAIIVVIPIIVVGRLVIEAGEGNRIAIRNVESSPALGGKPGVEFRLASNRLFPAVGTPVILQIGKNSFQLAEPRPDSPNTLVFTLTRQEFSGLRNESPIILRAEPDTLGHWDFGYLEKTDILKGQR